MEPKTQFIRSLLRLLKTVEADDEQSKAQVDGTFRGRYQAARPAGREFQRIIMQANRRPPVPAIDFGQVHTPAGVKSAPVKSGSP